MYFLLTLQSLLTDEQISTAPVLVLGNKIDIPGAASEDEIRHVFGLHGQTTGKVRHQLIPGGRGERLVKQMEGIY